MDITEYKGVNGRRIMYAGRIYAICDWENSGMEPEEYSRMHGGGWCSLPVIDLGAKAIRDNVYPFHMMTFDWNDNNTEMIPKDVDLRPFGEYDIVKDDFVSTDDNAHESKNGNEDLL
jgi:hypothetical protein